MLAPLARAEVVLEVLTGADAVLDGDGVLAARLAVDVDEAGLLGRQRHVVDEQPLRGGARYLDNSEEMIRERYSHIEAGELGDVATEALAEFDGDSGT